MPDEGTYFKKELFRSYSTPPRRPDLYIYQAWDFAISTGKENDYTVGITIGVDHNDAVYVLDMKRFRSSDGILIAETVRHYALEWDATMIGVEDGQIWRSIETQFIKVCQEKHTYPSYKALKPLTDKMVRADPLKGRMQAGKIYFPSEAQNTAISVRLNINNLTAAGTTLYSERHDVTTNAQGLFSVEAGAGTLLAGSFATIDWASGDKFLETSLDANGATGGYSFIVMGATQLISVPYALNSEETRWVKVSGENTRVGNSGFNMSGTNNTSNGKDALFSNTTGNNNTAIGKNTLFFNTTGNNNTAIGVNALENNETGTFNSPRRRLSRPWRPPGRRSDRRRITDDKEPQMGRTERNWPVASRYSQLKTRFQPLFDAIAEGAPGREAGRTLPHEQISWLKAAGFGALRVPVDHGGSGVTIPELFRLLIDLAEADSNIAQSLRGHFAFVEDMLSRPEAVAQPWFQRFVAGEIVGNAWSETGDVKLGERKTSLIPQGADFALDGVKHYSTGAIFAEWIDVLATRSPDGEVDVLEEELRQHQRRYDNLKEETDTMRRTADQLRAELAAEREQEASLVGQQAQIPSFQAEKAEKPRSRFTPASWQTRDDLTAISGIGPGIQKKLNQLGIYTFQQIAEFTPEGIEKVTPELKVFKGRIGRDNWIGQAAALRKK